MSYNSRNPRGNYQGSPMGRGGNQNTNFVSGGQNYSNGRQNNTNNRYKPNDRPLIQMPNQQQKPLMQQPQQQQKPTQQYQTQQQQQSTPQYQTTNTNVQQPQSQLKSIMKPLMKSEIPTPVAPTPTPAPAPVPVPAVTPLVTPEKVDNNSSIDGNNVMDASNSETKPKRSWSAGINKLSKKERRNRRNKRIGKLVRPKNAIMVLNELCGGATLRFDDIGTQNGLFGVTVSVDNVKYEAYASSKNGAKQKVCENALKGYIANKIKAKQQTPTITPELMDTDEVKVEDEDSAEDVSWCHLASFALYKLMDSWQDVSEIMQPDAIFQKINQKSNAPKPIKELPVNASDIHPVMLLHQMRPGTVIEDVSSSGRTPRIIYTVKVNVDGDEVFGQGPNKKTARKNCAQAAMEKHFGVVYPPEPASTPVSVA